MTDLSVVHLKRLVIIIFYTNFDCKYGEIFIAGDENGLAELFFRDCKWNYNFCIKHTWFKNDSFFKDAVKQINEYFDGSRYKFNLNINPKGNELQLAVWKEINKISYGNFRTFEDIAISIHKTDNISEIVMAVYSNPLPLIIPSHRVYYDNYDEFNFKRRLFMNERFMNYKMSWNISVN